MKRVITYGTFDLFHEGHYNILKRAKELGDYLIVGVTSTNYDRSRGKLNVQQNLMERIKNVQASGFADEIIVEEYEGQKIRDIQEKKVDIFAIGSDWLGKFDYLKEYCEVIYLERTKGISSTLLRNERNGIVRLGIVGTGRIANRLVMEAGFVSGMHIEGVYGHKFDSATKFATKYQLSFATDKYDDFLSKVDAVYIATPHLTHFKYARDAILSKKHVLCEKPLVLSEKEAIELYQLADKNNVVLLEAIKTAYTPAFLKLIGVAKSGAIGYIRNIDATFTKLVENNTRELDINQAGGSMTELSSYPLLIIIKLLGTNINDFNCFYLTDSNNVDLFTKFNLIYHNTIATGKVGLGVKSEGDLIISGTLGYIYVPAPWWKTEYFEVRYEDINNNKKYFEKFEGDGLRYELATFITMINNKQLRTYMLFPEESIKIVSLIEKFLVIKNDKKAHK